MKKIDDAFAIKDCSENNEEIISFCLNRSILEHSHYVLSNSGKRKIVSIGLNLKYRFYKDVK